MKSAVELSRRGTEALGLGLLVLALVSGCSSGSQAGRSQPPKPTTVVSRGPLRVTQAFSTQFHGLQIDHLAMTGKWVAYASGTDAGRSNPDEVNVLNISTGARREAGRTRWHNGIIDWVEATGGWIFWTDAQRVATDASGYGAWTLRALNLSTGWTGILDSGGAKSALPIPRAGAGRLVWFVEHAPGSSLADIRAFSIRDAKVTVVTRAIPVPNSIGAASTGPVWDALQPATGRSDLWSVPWVGGKVYRLTGTGKARNVRVGADGKTAVWELGNMKGESGIAFGDPFGPTAAVMADSSASAGVASADFAAYAADGGNELGLFNASSRGKPTLIARGGILDPSCRFAADANRLAYCTQTQGSSQVTLIVDVVTAAP